MKMYLIRAFVLFLFVVFSWNVQQAALLEDGGSVLIMPKNGKAVHEIAIPTPFTLNGELIAPLTIRILKQATEIIHFQAESIGSLIVLPKDLPSGFYTIHIELEDFHLKQKVLIE